MSVLKVSFKLIIIQNHISKNPTYDYEKQPIFTEKKQPQTLQNLKINHNFVKPHEDLDGKTPAESAGIDLNLGENKYLDLIKQDGTKPNFVNNLGKRIKKVTIVNEEIQSK